MSRDHESEPGTDGGARRSPRGQRDARPGAPRRVAYDVLEAVRESDAYANLVLPSRIRAAGLSAADAGLATELCYGTLRMQGYYDRVIGLAAGRPLEKIDPAVLDALRLGVHQLLGMRVAPHAAVNETVALVSAVGHRSAVPFANAVLRAVSRTTAEDWREGVAAAAKNADDRLAALYSHPTWIVRALRQSLSAEAARTPGAPIVAASAGDSVAADAVRTQLEELLAADNVSPRVNLVALPGLAELGELDGVSDRYSPLGATSSGGDPDSIPAVNEGRARVQDEGSQLVALALSRWGTVVGGERWLDMCAGPGGKAALLAAEAARTGATFTANEVVPARAGLVAQSLQRVAPETEVWNLDGRTIGASHPAFFDRILLDAPCTGLGALRRRPEARWRKSRADVTELSTLQAELFDSAVAALRPGGVLAYVTCSPHLAETVEIVEAAAERHGSALERLDTRAAVASVSTSPIDLRGDSRNAQLWPHRHGTDAMFIALFRATSPRASAR